MPPSSEYIFINQHRQTNVGFVKNLQKHRYFPAIDDVPKEAVNHLISTLHLNSKSLPLVSKNTVIKHQSAIRSFLKVKVFDCIGRKVLTRAVLTAAQTKDNPADLINAAGEELIKERFALFTFSMIDNRIH